MFKSFMKISYSIIWWIYTFPMVAMTITTILNYHLNKVAIQKGEKVLIRINFKIVPL